jgi:hypothetical protein
MRDLPPLTQELGWVLLLVGGPMLTAALWTLWQDSAWRVRFHRNRELRRLRRAQRSIARESLEARRWV